MPANFELNLLLDNIAIDAFIKNASLGETLQSGLSAALGGIQAFVKNNTDFSSPKAAGLSLIKILGPAILFRINPLIGMAITFAAKEAGVNIPSIWDSLFGPVKEKLEQGAQIMPAELDSLISQNLKTAEFHESLSKFAEIKKTAQRAPAGGYAMFPPKNVPLLIKMFGFLGPNKSKNIVTGFLAWFLKTALVSAGLMGASAGAAKMLDSVHPGEWKMPENLQNTSYQQSESKDEGLPPPPPPQSNSFKPSGKGQQYHPNNNANMWIVPLVNSDLGQTLLLWAGEVYPELKGRENEIAASGSFNRMVNILDEYLDSQAPNYLVVPKSFKRIKDIVDSYVGDISRMENNNAQKS